MRTRTTQPSARRDRRAPRQSVRRVVGARGEQRTREAGGPQDQALYACDCGLTFAEPVSTHVTCPRCGVEQAW